MPPKKKSKTVGEGKKEEKVQAKEEEKEKEEDENKEEDDDDDGAPAAAAAAASVRSKRRRRDSTSYEPEDFTLVSTKGGAKASPVVTGRGSKLADLESVKASIEKSTPEDLPFAYKFVFGSRGKVTKKEMKNHLLEFNGYLPPLPKGKKLSEEELEDYDKTYELKFYAKASKLTLNQIKTLLTVFSIDRNDDDEKPLKTKEELVDRVCDFLGNPSDLLAKHPEVAESSSNGKKKAPPKKKTAKGTKGKTSGGTKKVPEAVPKDPFALVKDHTKGEKPTDDAMRQWVRAYVVCFDMDSATTKHAIMTASTKFGVDLAPSKGRIKELLAEEM